MPTTTKPLAKSIAIHAAVIGQFAARGDFDMLVFDLARFRPAKETAYFTAVAFSFLDSEGQQKLRDLLCAAVKSR